jgi:ABC-type multidrug transport system permease subunit
MVTKYPGYIYILVIATGIGIMFIHDIEPFPYVLGLIYLFCGLLFGILWPQKSWRWGLWIAGPMLFLMLLSTAFAGITRIFLEDVLVIIVPITSACLGSFVGSRLMLRKTNPKVINQ